MDIDGIFKCHKKIKKIKMSDEGYEILKFFLEQNKDIIREPTPVEKFGFIPIEIDNTINGKMEVVYDE